MHVRLQRGYLEGLQATASNEAQSFQDLQNNVHLECNMRFGVRVAMYTR